LLGRIGQRGGQGRQARKTDRAVRP